MPKISGASGYNAACRGWPKQETIGESCMANFTRTLPNISRNSTFKRGKPRSPERVRLENMPPASPENGYAFEVFTPKNGQSSEDHYAFVRGLVNNSVSACKKNNQIPPLWRIVQGSASEGITVYRTDDGSGNFVEMTEESDGTDE